MNNRDYKQFAAGEFYHVYNRGVGKMNIFEDDQDYEQFLKRLRMVLGMSKMTFDSRGRIRLSTVPPESFTIVAYCLMPNHFHFLIRQNTDLPIGKLLSKVLTSYAKYFNKKHGRVGTLFQDIFKAIRVDNERYLTWLSGYIHLNPKTAGLVTDASGWRWSSLANYLSNSKDIADAEFILDILGGSGEYMDFIKDEAEIMQRKNDDESLFLD